MDNLDSIAQDILACQQCELRMGATRPVPGHGEVGAKYFLLGEAPGFTEDAEGLPFIGSSGRRLDKLLALANIDINDCYLSNTCRCCMPMSLTHKKLRDPRKKEIKACAPFLWREIRLVKPQYVIALGSVPLSLFCDYGARTMHGSSFEWELDENNI